MIRAISKIILCAVWTIFIVPLQYVYEACLYLSRRKPVKQSPFIRVWYCGMRCLLGIRITQRGTLPVQKNQQSLYIANHSSYLDILVLGERLPSFFVAKSDMANWPIFGFLTKLGRTLFIDRQRSLIKQQMKLVSHALNEGKQLLIFPESKTSDACHILPFKSGLLNVLYEVNTPDIAVIPVCVVYTAINGLPLSEKNKDIVAWYGGMTLPPHAWTVLQQKSIDVCVDILPPLAINDYTDAKELTWQCEDKIKTAFAARSPVLFDTPVK